MLQLHYKYRNNFINLLLKPKNILCFYNFFI
nr:MAG TPA: hypothetical protein [Caudoviricetes sp.]